MFGENLRVGCTFPISRSKLSPSECEKISQRAMAVLLGSEDSAIEALDSARVGSFGNSERSNPAEWVPVIVVDAPDSAATDNSGSGSRCVSNCVHSKSQKGNIIHL